MRCGEQPQDGCSSLVNKGAAPLDLAWASSASIHVSAPEGGPHLAVWKL